VGTFTSPFFELPHALWGDPDFGGENAPTEKGYTKIYSNEYAFAATIGFKGSKGICI
jgi:hypothetical protein